tara:strand:- start:2911 stop:3081 length:171 start_codon:yes stop_codon:yes gene_type:complete
MVYKQQNKINLDDKTNAVCECGKVKKILTFRNLKNKWPICECKQPMRITRNADTPV